VYCDGPEDCTPGQLCCGTASAAGSYDSLACEWSSFGCNRMCNVGNDSECDSGEVCTQSLGPSVRSRILQPSGEPERSLGIGVRRSRMAHRRKITRA
jgi:hypothetical protein